jgi:hypothetical protein
MTEDISAHGTAKMNVESFTQLQHDMLNFIGNVESLKFISGERYAQ